MKNEKTNNEKKEDFTKNSVLNINANDNSDDEQTLVMLEKMVNVLLQFLTEIMKNL